MAVYTILTKHDIQDTLSAYNLGELLRFEPISSGIENTNYFVWTVPENATTSLPTEWVLTIFENLSSADIPFYNQLTTYLKERGFCVPAPAVMRDGSDIFSITSEGKQKYGVIVPKFNGAALEEPEMQDCYVMGEYLANMHTALTDYPSEKKIERSVEWCRELVKQLTPFVPDDDHAVLNLALSRYVDYKDMLNTCSLGIVHGDLFRDNVLFEKGRVSGVIDFYHAGKTVQLFDLAVVANDWAVNAHYLPSAFSDEQGRHEQVSDVSLIYNEQKLSSLLAGYQCAKPFLEKEIVAWPRLLELAAFRFWLSRLKTKYLEGYQNEVKQGEAVKSPLAMKLILRAAMMRH